ncbi:MAG TPA: hypothetical protein VEA37_04385, partial [Flavobacterium sp.]|nr:hypothetical protein [Flavobacterium sp.]
EYPADFYCDYITASLYGQTEIYYIQPYDAIMLSKLKLDDKASYYLYLSTLQAEIDLTDGVIITLENGSKIIKPDLEAKVKPFVGTVSGYEYSVQVPLTDKDIQQLKSHKITGYQIGKFKEAPGRIEEIKNALPCLLTK